MLNSTQKNNLALRIAQHILQNEPVTLDQIEARASIQPWYSIPVFDDIMQRVKKHPEIAAVLRKDGVVYRRRREYVSPRAAERLRIDTHLRATYPKPTVDLDAIPFKTCSCALFQVNWSYEEHGHRAQCDAVRFPEAYRMQYTRRI